MWKLIFNRLLDKSGSFLLTFPPPPSPTEFYFFENNSESYIVWEGVAEPGTGNTTKTHSVKVKKSRAMLLSWERELTIYFFPHIYIHIYM